MLILIMGLPGTGKTTFARALTGRIGAVHLNSDRIRRVMGKRGTYAPADKQAVYDEMLRQADAALRAGRDVIVDSTFYREAIRRPYQQMAENLGVDLHWIVIQAGETALRERLSKPRPDSEADFSVYEKIKAAYEPPEQPYLELWSDRIGLEEMLLQATAYLGM